MRSSALLATADLPGREERDGPARPLIATGAIAACAAAGSGMAVLTLLVLAGWIAAPHTALGLTGLTGVFRGAAVLWLIGHHVGFTLHGAGRIGLLPLGLVLLPGALLWRAGHWVVRTGQVRRLRHVGYAALALAAPYAVLAGVLAFCTRGGPASSSLSQAVLSGFLLALVAGGLGGARALAPWRQLVRLLPERLRSVIVGMTGGLAVLFGAGALLAGAALGSHLSRFGSVNALLAPGLVGAVLLLLAQLAYLPNAIVWAVSFMLGPGFAFGSGAIVAPTGAALGRLPAFPMLAALPQGLHGAVPPWLSAAVLALPYLAGLVSGLLLARTAPTPVIEAAPLWGFAVGAMTGGVLGVLAAFAGGPLGDGRLAAVGPSPWQVGLVAAVEVGVAAAITAGVANWLRLRTRPGAGHRPAAAGGLAAVPVRRAGPRAGQQPDEDGHVIYLDPWAGEQSSAARPPPGRGPASLP